MCFLQECKGDYRPGSCPGICGALTTCLDCTIQGQGAVTVNATAALVHNEQCAWCVKEAQCQKIDGKGQRSITVCLLTSFLSERKGVCNSTEGTKSGLDGWWGKNSSRLVAASECRLEDYPAGLHWLKHRYPPNWSQPDAVRSKQPVFPCFKIFLFYQLQVEIVRVTSMNFQFDPLFDKENGAGGEYSALFKGFFHPLGAPSSTLGPIKVSLVSAAAHAWLYLSPNEDPNQKVIVAELDDATYESEIAKRPAGRSIFPVEARGYRYYLEHRATQHIAGPKQTQVASTMQLEWTGALSVTARIRQVVFVSLLKF